MIRLRKILLLLLSFGLIFSLSKNIIEFSHKVEFYEGYKTEYQKQQKQKKALESELAKANDYYVVEKNIRERLNLLKPDEIAVILPKLSLSPSPTPIIDKPPHTQWLELFMR